MSRFAHRSVRTLLDRHPWADEVLRWAGLDPSAVDPHMTLEALCWRQLVDVDKVERALEQSEPDPVDWSSLDHDEWTWHDEEAAEGVDWEDVERRWVS